MKKSSKLIIGLGVAAVFAVGLAVGVPFGTLLLVGAFLLCPLMMMFMMNGMQNGSCHSEKDKTTADDSSIGTQADKNWLR
jgi:hypothetical protein